jgi:hypothetical protein
MIIDQVYYREIQGQLRQKPPERSIDLMLTLFNERNVDYDQTHFKILRKLCSLRSTKQPVHGGEHKAIKILKTLGIEYPFDWEKAGKICLQHLISSLTGLRSSLIHHNNKPIK